MRPSYLLLAFPLVAGTLDAQRARRYNATPPVLQTLTVDVASAFQQRYRAMIEPLVFGRFAIGVSGEYTTEPDNDGYGYINYPETPVCPIEMLCARDVARFASSYYDTDPDYRAWNFNLHGRWYPAPLSYSGRRQSASFYVGEFIGYHERRTSQAIYYGCPTCYPCPACAEVPPDSIRTDTVTFRPGSTYPVGPSTFREIIKGWEPGAEFGVRIVPTRHVVMDIGGTFRLTRLLDYTSSKPPGSVISRLNVSVGVGW